MHRPWVAHGSETRRCRGKIAGDQRKASLEDNLVQRSAVALSDMLGTTPLVFNFVSRGGQRLKFGRAHNLSLAATHC